MRQLTIDKRYIVKRHLVDNLRWRQLVCEHNKNCIGLVAKACHRYVGYRAGQFKSWRSMLRYQKHTGAIFLYIQGLDKVW